MGNTVRKVAIVAVLAVSMAANAAVTVINPVVNTPLNFSASMDYQPQAGLYEFYSASGNWSASASFVPVFGGVEVVSGTMVHLIAPHPGEMAPSPNTFGFAFVVVGGVPGAPNPVTALLPHPIGPHSDSFSALIAAPIQTPGAAYSLTLTGSHPVPEPQQFALFAGLGLLGFGVYRRMRS